MTAKLDPPPVTVRPNVVNNRRVLAARLRAIATLVKRGKIPAAWHALTTLADKIDPQ